MSNSKIRKKKTCLNCGAFVENTYCPKCGQENTESRQSFIHIFTHFISDFIHYDNSFWLTVRYLLFSPGKLSTEYMNGRRKSYLNPFTLYIFISFFVFFIPTLLSDNEKEENNTNISKEVVLNDSIHIALIKESDSILIDTIKIKQYTIGKYRFSGTTVQHLQNFQDSLSDDKKIPFFEYYVNKVLLILNSHPRDSDIENSIGEFLIHNLSKVLIFYMPLFAFWLWLFHSKKKRYYFDSGIFTLHFFSFWLFIISIYYIIHSLLKYFGVGETVDKVLLLAIMLWIPLYFFRANYNFYQESRIVSNIKAFMLFWINFFCIIIVLILYAIYALVHQIPL